MRILICPDSFKGSLSSSEVCEAIEKGLKKSNPEAKIIKLPFADGGEGTLECLKNAVGGKFAETETENIFFEKMTGGYLLLNDGSAFIETATASGITTVSKDRLNPMKASSKGTGILIKNALDNGAKSIIFALGGSATNDGGMGVLSALGVSFLDENGNELSPVGESLMKVKNIRLTPGYEKYKNVKFSLACDVDNPFCGKKGAAYVFASQKGATENEIALLDKGLFNLANVIENATGKDIKNISGAGAAGGICGGLWAFFNCGIKSGFDVLSEKTNLLSIIDSVDLVITGEGRTDFQTSFGKLPVRISRLSNEKNKRCILISGDVEKGLDTAKLGFERAYKIKNDEITLENAINNAYNLLTALAQTIKVV